MENDEKKGFLTQNRLNRGLKFYENKLMKDSTVVKYILKNTPFAYTSVCSQNQPLSQ
jgi:hypothetical protein